MTDRQPFRTPVPAAFGRGLALLRENRLLDAAACFAEAVRDAPSHAGARGNLGATLARLGRHADALDCFRAAAILEPFSPAAQANLGQALFGCGRHGEASESFARAALLAPRDPLHRLRRAHALLAAGSSAGVIEAYREALDLPDPEPALGPADRATALNNLGNALRAADRPFEAVPCFEQALALHSEAVLLVNLGKTLLETRDLGRAEACFRAALRMGGESADASCGLAIALLAQGALPEGFLLLEHRWRSPQMRSGAREFEQPQWRGEPANSRTLLIHAEQGQGDTLQFCRYAVLAARRGFRVVLEVQPSLVRLLRGLPNVAAVIARGDPLPAFDLHCPMLSLPLAFGTALHSIPAQSFLAAPKPSPRSAGPLRVGLCWAGNAYADRPELNAVDRRRSIDPSRLLPLLAIPGIRFTSLQKHRTDGFADPRLSDPMGAVADFADTAAIVAELDLVIAVDSAVAHLAAGLGRPVWLLDRFDACWRWLDGYDTSPWYPSLRLFRQTEPGDWAGVIGRIEHELRPLARQQT